MDFPEAPNSFCSSAGELLEAAHSVQDAPLVAVNGEWCEAVGSFGEDRAVLIQVSLLSFLHWVDCIPDVHPRPRSDQLPRLIGRAVLCTRKLVPFVPRTGCTCGLSVGEKAGRGHGLGGSRPRGTRPR